MGFDGLGFRVRSRKVMVTLIRTCHRSVCNHPFLAGILCFLLFLYRLSPFVFSLLVSASPILVCTAVLLGTLLSFGQPYIPEIDKEEKVTYEVSSLKSGVVENATVADRDGSFVVERHVAKEEDTMGNDVEDVTLVHNEISQVKEDESFILSTPLIDETSRDIQCEKRVIKEVEGESDDSVLEKKRDILEENTNDEGVLSLEEIVEDQVPVVDIVGDENLQVDDDNSLVVPSIVHKDDELISSLLSTWKRVGHGEDVDGNGGGDGDDDDDRCLDSESDGDESSSPDASLADIIPMLDELHPLLDSETPIPAHLSNHEYDPGSERSHGSSNDGSDDSDEDNETHGKEEDGDEGEEEEGKVMKGDDEDRSKSAIKWTEDDQKNLMDLGTSELERNQRLENLIARRRARKSMNLMAEKNLIDFDSVDLPFKIAPISVTRNNPFDFNYGSYDNMDLPPMPGSAPSIMQPRQNPFDLPYDSSEEKPDLKGDSFQQEFSAFHQRESSPQREAFFRRHESFNLGPSTLGGRRSYPKWKPFFVPDWLAMEGNGSPVFQRQLSEVSESMLSSVPDSESAYSVVDGEDRKLDEVTASQEAQCVDHASTDDEGSQSSGDVDSLDVEPAENIDAQHDMDEIILGDVERHREIEPNLSDVGAPSHFDFDASEIHSRIEAFDDGCSSRSSLSSLIGTDEKIFTFNEDMSYQPPLFPESEFHFITGPVDDYQQKESVSEKPVFDFSPLPTENLLSFSSVSSDTLPDVSELGLPTISVESRHQQPEVHGDIIKQSNSCFQELHSAPLEEPSENEPRMRDVSRVIEHDAVLEIGPSQVSSSSVNLNQSMVPESILEHFSVDSGSVSLENGSVEEGIARNVEDFHQDQYQGDLPRVVGLLLEAGQCLDEDLDYEPKEQQTSIHCGISLEAEPVKVQEMQLESSTLADESVDKGIVTDKEDIVLTESHQLSSSSLDVDINVDDNCETNNLQPPSVSEEVSQVHTNFSSEEDVFQMDKVEFSNSDSIIDADFHHNMDIEVVFSKFSHQVGTDEDDWSLVLEKQQALPDKFNGEASFASHGESQEPFTMVAESEAEENIIDNVNGSNGVKETISENSLPTHSSSFFGVSESPEREQPSEGEEFKGSILDEIVHEEFYLSDVVDENIVEGENEIKEIDEGILLELDAVGDFNADEVLLEGTNSENMQFTSLTKDSETQENHLELQVHEARSVEDIDMAFKQLHEGADADEVIPPFMIEESKDFAEINSQLPAFEDRSVEDIVTAVKQQSKGTEIEEVTLPSYIEQYKDSADINSQLSVSEAGSVEDSDMKQLREEADIEEGIPPSTIEQSQDSAEINSQLPAFEARSVEDIHMAFKQLHEGADIEEVILPSMIEDSRDSADITSQLPAFEARSIEDIDVAFNQLHEEAEIGEMILPSMIEDSKDSVDVDSRSSAFESRPVEETHTTLQKVSDSCLSELPKPLESEDDSTKVEAHNLVSTKGIEFSYVESDIQENSQSHNVYSTEDIEFDDQEGCSHELVPTEEVDVISGESLVQGSSMTSSENEAGDQQGGIHDEVPSKDVVPGTVESSVEGSSKSLEVESGDEAHGSHGVISTEEVESDGGETIVQGSRKNAAYELKHEHSEKSED